MSTVTQNDFINATIVDYSFLEINKSVLKGELELWISKWISNKNDGKLVRIIFKNVIVLFHK